MRKFKTLLFVGIALVIVACGSEEPEVVEREIVVTELVIEEVLVEVEGEAVIVTVEVPVEKEVETSGEEVAFNSNAPTSRTSNSWQSPRLIIKTGDMSVEVENTDAAVGTATDIVLNLGGYIVSQQVYTGDKGFRFATIRMGVPVEQFEVALRSLRGLGVVLEESATGQDVTEEYVDLDSRLGNLLATQERLRSFLEAATNVEEALDVDEELRKIEEELNVIQGRMNYLQDRAAFSTIHLQLNPFIPTPTPTATFTPTPTPTVTPLPTPQTWRPGDTAQTALVRLQDDVQQTGDTVIYTGIVCGPWVLLLTIVGFVGLGIYRRRTQREASPAPINDALT